MGVSLWFGQIKRSSKTLAQTRWVGGQTDWTCIKTTFTTPEDHEVGWLRPQWDLTEGETAWSDDVCLADAGG